MPIYEITEIIAHTDRHITVRSKSGRPVRVPRRYGRQEIGFLPGHIVIPAGLDKKIGRYLSETAST